MRVALRASGQRLAGADPRKLVSGRRDARVAQATMSISARSTTARCSRARKASWSPISPRGSCCPYSDGADLTYYKPRSKEALLPPVGHFQKQWINACKNGGKTACDFEYSGNMIEQLLLGLVAYRVGKKIDTTAPKAASPIAPRPTTCCGGSIARGGRWTDESHYGLLKTACSFAQKCAIQTASHGWEHRRL